LACSIPGVLGAHDLRTRMSGTRWFVQLHVELSSELSLLQAHVLCDQVEAAIRTEFTRAEVLVHADPIDPGNP
jgi:ferrous-iron efflux pump FieF